MLAVRLVSPNETDPLNAIDVIDIPVGAPTPGLVTIHMCAASINSSDFATMRGYGVDRELLPTVLGSDGAGIDDEGNEFIVYPIVANPTYADPMLDPSVRMLSQGIDGTFAEHVRVPAANLVAKPAEMSWESAACLGTAWLTAYSALFTRAEILAGEVLLVQGAGGGVATAAITLAAAAGVRVWVTSRDPVRAVRAVRELGAERAIADGDSIGGEVDAVLDCVGAATIVHSLQSLRAGGRVVTVGAAGGSSLAQLDLSELFLRTKSIVGSAMGTPEELTALAAYCVAAGIDVTIDSVYPLARGDVALAHAFRASPFGKVVMRCDR